MAALVAVIAGVWWPSGRNGRRDDVRAWRDARIILTAMVLLSPAAHPWYLLWALALVPMTGGPALWVASLTLPWGYAALGHIEPDGTAAWDVSAWLLAVSWVPIFAALAVDVGYRLRRRPDP